MHTLAKEHMRELRNRIEIIPLPPQSLTALVAALVNRLFRLPVDDSGDENGQRASVAIPFSFPSPTPAVTSRQPINQRPNRSNNARRSKGAWKTWEVRDMANNLLATSQVGMAASPTASPFDRSQLLGFTGGAQTLTGFRIYGKVGSATQNNTNNRIKEIVGLSVPPPPMITTGSVLIVR